MMHIQKESIDLRRKKVDSKDVIARVKQRLPLAQIRLSKMLLHHRPH